jgi:hypothetical protein
MKHKLLPVRSSQFPMNVLLLVAALLGCGPLGGCTGFYEDVCESWRDYWHKPDPWKVVTSTDSGDRRAKFMAMIQEPAAHGQDQKEQDLAVRFLTDEATKDSSLPCRLQAIRVLGHYKDPRAAEALQAAYYQATTFGLENNNLLKQQALQSLGETGSPTARDLLLRVARAGAQEKEKQERQMTLDERLAAIRALSHFKDQEVQQTLVRIYQSEKDVALRDRTRETLVVVTGNHLPADLQGPAQTGNAPGANNTATAQAGNPGSQPVQPVSFTSQIRHWLGWQ